MALSRKKKIIILVAGVVVLALIVIISVVATRKDEPEVTTVKIDVRPELRSTVTASGEVRPIRYIKLTSEVQGRIQEIYVNAGDQVTKGQSLCASIPPSCSRIRKRNSPPPRLRLMMSRALAMAWPRPSKAWSSPKPLCRKPGN